MMTESTPSEHTMSSDTTKPSVVDDFFSALFANNSTTPNNQTTGHTDDNNSISHKHTSSSSSHSSHSSSHSSSHHSHSISQSISDNSHPMDTAHLPDPNKPSTTTTTTCSSSSTTSTVPPPPPNHPSSYNHPMQEPILPARQPVSYDDVLSPTQELDEFDEYSLLSRGQRHPRQQQPPRPVGSDIPAQILSKKEINWSTVKPESRMLVRQFPRNANKHDVLEHFSKYGEVIEVVQKDSFGFVHFEDPKACARAVQAENGNILHGVTLDLEICKRKPYFARVKEDVTTGVHDDGLSTESRVPPQSPPPPPSSSSSLSPTRRPLKRRNSNPTTRSVRPRPFPEQARRSPQEKYTVKKATDISRPIPFRTGYAVPTVQIIAWGNLYHHFLAYVESVFQQYQVRTATVMIPNPAVNRAEVIKQLVLEGVKAIVMVDRHSIKKSKVNLQVFAPNHGQGHHNNNNNGGGGGVHYDEYDFITPLDAVNIIQRTHPNIQTALPYQPQQQQQSQPQRQHQQQQQQQQQQRQQAQQRQQHQQQLHQQRQQQQLQQQRQQHQQRQQQLPPPQQPYQQQPYVPRYQPTSHYNSPMNTMTAATVSSPYTAVAPPPQQQQQQLTTAPQPIQFDANTLNTLYNMIQPNPSPMVNQHQPPPPQQQQQQPTIPQLIATLMNGLNQSPQHIPSSPVTVTQPTPPPPPPPTATTASNTAQPSVAALLSTIANGNPGLLDSLTKTNPSLVPLLYQLSLGNSTDSTNTNTTSPPPPPSYN